MDREGEKHVAEPNRSKTRSRLNCCAREREGFPAKPERFSSTPCFALTLAADFPCPTVSATRTREAPAKRVAFPWWYSRESFRPQHTHTHAHRQTSSSPENFLHTFPFDGFPSSSSVKQKMIFTVHYQCTLLLRQVAPEQEEIFTFECEKTNPGVDF